MIWPTHILAHAAQQDWFVLHCTACDVRQEISAFGGLKLRDLYKLVRYFWRAHRHVEDGI